MEAKVTIESRRHQRRRTRDRDTHARSHSNEGSKRGSQSPPRSRVVILAKNPLKANNTSQHSSAAKSPLVSSSLPSQATPTPTISIIQSSHSASQTTSNASSSIAANSDEAITEMVANMPPVM